MTQYVTRAKAQHICRLIWDTAVDVLTRLREDFGVRDVDLAETERDLATYIVRFVDDFGWFLPDYKTEAEMPPLAIRCVEVRNERAQWRRIDSIEDRLADLLAATQHMQALIEKIHELMPTGSEFPQEPSGDGPDGKEYLGVVLDDREVTRGECGSVSFGNAEKQWILFSELFNAGWRGVPRDRLKELLWDSTTKSETSLDHLKAATNRRIESLDLEILPNQRGVWKLVDMKSTA